MKKMDAFLIFLTCLVLLQSGLSHQWRTGSLQSESVAQPVSLDGIIDVGTPSILDIHNFQTKGRSTAPIALAEFTDYECPYCARHAQTVGPEIEKRFVDTGQLRYAFLNNPLPFHAHAKLFAAAAACAGAQNHFFDMHDALFSKRPESKEAILMIARAKFINEPRFADCLENQDTQEQIEQEVESANSLALHGTPAFVLGTSLSGDRFLVKKIIRGAQPFEVFKVAIQGLLANIEQDAH